LSHQVHTVEVGAKAEGQTISHADSLGLLQIELVLPGIERRNGPSTASRELDMARGMAGFDLPVDIPLSTLPE